MEETPTPATMTGEATLPAERPKVWAMLDDAAVLKVSISGRQSLKKMSDTTFAAVVEVKIGPVGASFKGKAQLSDVDSLNGYTISGEGGGGVAGFASGGAGAERRRRPGVSGRAEFLRGRASLTCAERLDNLDLFASMRGRRDRKAVWRKSRSAREGDRNKTQGRSVDDSRFDDGERQGGRRGS